MNYVCVYCGSADGSRGDVGATAVALGSALAAHGLGLVYGGARAGLMGRLADSALEAGAPVVGVMPRQFQRYEVEHPGLTELHWADTLWERKRLMTERADGFVVLPGGFGTLDEALEAVNLRQVKAHQKPIVFINNDGFFDHLLALCQTLRDWGYTYAATHELFTCASTAEEAIGNLQREWSATGHG